MLYLIPGDNTTTTTIIIITVTLPQWPHSPLQDGPLNAAWPEVIYTPEREVVWWAGRAEEDSNIHQGHWSGYLKDAMDDEKEHLISDDNTVFINIIIGAETKSRSLSWVQWPKLYSVSGDYVIPMTSIMEIVVSEKAIVCLGYMSYCLGITKSPTSTSLGLSNGERKFQPIIIHTKTKREQDRQRHKATETPEICKQAGRMGEGWGCCLCRRKGKELQQSTSDLQGQNKTEAIFPVLPQVGWQCWFLLSQ